MVTIISLSHKDYQNHCAFKNVAYFSTCRVWICLCVLWLNLSTLIIKMELPHVVNRGNMVTANLCSIIYMYIVLCTVNILLWSSWSCFYGSWIYNYLCLSPLALWGVYSIQHYVIKFVRDLRQVGGFLRLLRFPPPI